VAKSIEKRLSFIFWFLSKHLSAFCPLRRKALEKVQTRDSEKFGRMLPMATRQQRSIKSKSRSRTALFWLLFVILLIGLVFYFGFIKVD
jgi:hypothetical protein